MSKITFRADERLIQRLEEFDASKSEVMREALREYLGNNPSDTDIGRRDDTSEGVDLPRETDGESLDDILAKRVDNLIAERVDKVVAERLETGGSFRKPQDVHVNITMDTDSGSATVDREEERKTTPQDTESSSEDEGKTCKQCGDTLSPSTVYCPNCGEKASHRVFCECGDEIRSDWAFCPSCGRRTPAADVLDGA